MSVLQADYEADMKLDEPVRSKLVKLYEILYESKAKLREIASRDNLNVSSQIRFVHAAFQVARSSVIAGRTKEQNKLLFALYTAEMTLKYRSPFTEAFIRREETTQEVALQLFGEVMS